MKLHKMTLFSVAAAWVTLCTGPVDVSAATYGATNTFKMALVVNQSSANIDALRIGTHTFLDFQGVVTSLRRLGVRVKVGANVLDLSVADGRPVDTTRVHKPVSGDLTVKVNGVVIGSLSTYYRITKASKGAARYLYLDDVNRMVQRFDIQTDWNGTTLRWLGATSVSRIKHLVVICQENHSFDNYFGTYPTAPGFLPLPGTPRVNGIPDGAYNLDASGRPVYPYTFGAEQAVTSDIDHSYSGMLQSWNHGGMNQYVLTNRSAADPTLPMGHYDYTTIGPYWDYAQHYALADNWFQPVFGPTTPNTMYLVSGQAGSADAPLTYTRAPDPGDQFTYRNIGDELTDKGVSWAWYQGELNIRKGNINDDPFMFFRNFRLGRYDVHTKDLSELDRDLATGTLPSVTFVKADGHDEHPGANITSGVNATVQLIDGIMNSPAWADTAIILTYDESGGYWDHAAPPDTSELGSDGLAGDGPRIPALVISPYAKRNYVSHVQYDTTSILKFIEWNWGLPPLERRDAAANNLLDLLDFQHPDPAKFLVTPTSDGRPPFDDATPAKVFLNNFLLASSGHAQPFALSGSTYIAVDDLRRNLNASAVDSTEGQEVSWHDHNLLVPMHGDSVRINGEPLNLGAPVLRDGSGEAYVPVDTLLPALGLGLDRDGRDVHIYTVG